MRNLIYCIFQFYFDWFYFYYVIGRNVQRCHAKIASAADMALKLSTNYHGNLSSSCMLELSSVRTFTLASSLCIDNFKHVDHIPANVGKLCIFIVNISLFLSALLKRRKTKQLSRLTSPVIAGLAG